MFSIIEILMVIIYLTIIGGDLYLIYKWAKKIISLKKEQNDLLKEIIKKMDKK